MPAEDVSPPTVVETHANGGTQKGRSPKLEDTTTKSQEGIGDDTSDVGSVGTAPVPPSPQFPEGSRTLPDDGLSSLYPPRGRPDANKSLPVGDVMSDGVNVGNSEPSPKSASKNSRTLTDNELSSLCAPSRRPDATAAGHVLQQSSTVEDDKGLPKRQRTPSFIQSLPVAEAQFEANRIDSILEYTSEVEPVTDSDRLVAGHAEESHSHERPLLISVRIWKPTVDTKLGVGFRSGDGELLMGNIAPTSPLANSPLRPGDRLISVDQHRNINHWTAVQAANYVRNKEGRICFVARTKNGDPNVAEATVYKSTPEEKVGISFKTNGGRLRVSNIGKEGLLGEMAVLQPGDYIQTINSIDVSELDSSAALELVRSMAGMITFRVKHTDTTELSVRDVMVANVSARHFSGTNIVAELADLDLESGLMMSSEFDIRPGFISVKVYKPTMDTKLGLSFKNPDGDQLQINNIQSQGMLAKSPMAPGQLVQSIGGVRCRKWTKEQALDYVKGAVGELLFVLRDATGDSSYAVAMAYKSTPREKLGISFKTSGGPLKIGNIRPDSLLCNSVLNCDDTVLSINHIPCEHLSPAEAVAVTQRNPESVVLVTRPHRGTGIVLSHISDMINGDDEYDGALRQDLEAQRIREPPGPPGTKISRACLGIFCFIVFAIFLVIMLGNRCSPYDSTCR